MSSISIEISTKVSSFLERQFSQNQKQQLQKLSKCSQKYYYDKSMDIYLYNIQKYLRKQKMINYYITPEDQKYFRTLLLVPVAKQIQKKGQNKYIFNYIKILNQDNIVTKNFKEGGFSNIRLAQIEFYYVPTTNLPSHSGFHEQSHSSALLKKWICIKTPKNRQIAQSGRFKHQIQILKMFRSAASAYLLKYYVSKQQKFIYRNCLMSDAYSSPSLEQYINTNSQILSLQKRIFLVHQIAQCLRFLKNYNIIHMDIKPNNIMISKNLMIKLFDFGQAYHYDICKNNYYPGYTMPYTAPQVFDNQPIYTSKIDIYSLGILLFQTIFYRLPFINSQNLQIIYKKKQQLKKLMIIPQQLHNYGDRYLINLIILLIIKCLDSNPQKRPYPSWIVIVLRQILRELG